MLAEVSPKGDGYYWKLDLKMTRSSGETLYSTTTPITARDDLGAGPIILSSQIYFSFGCPSTQIRNGRGFGYSIPHLVLTRDSRTKYKFYFKLDGMEMEWKEFEPVFFEQAENPDPNDLALISTFGWKQQAALGAMGIGFVHKGYTRFAVSGLKAAADCTESLWR